MRIFALLVAVSMAACAPRRPVAGSELLGNYVVEGLRPADCRGDRHGSSGQLARRIFHNNRLIAAAALAPYVSPHNRDRLLYTVVPACARNEAEAGSFYFDGARKAPVQVNPLGLQSPPEDIELYWSPDDRYVVVPTDEGKAVLLNLQTGEHSLYLADLFKRGGLFPSHAAFRGWAPDGSAMAVTIPMVLMHANRSLQSRTELIAVNPETLQDTYVETTEDSESRPFKWVPKNGSYALVTY